MIEPIRMCTVLKKGLNLPKKSKQNVLMSFPFAKEGDGRRPRIFIKIFSIIILRTFSFRVFKTICEYGKQKIHLPEYMNSKNVIGMNPLISHNFKT